jgi:excisionase family DNA binding protein
MEAKTEFNRSASSARPILDAAWNGRSTFSIEEAAKILSVSPWTAYQWAKAGEIPTIKIGSRVIVPRHALELLLDKASAAPPDASSVA